MRIATFVLPAVVGLLLGTSASQGREGSPRPKAAQLKVPEVVEMAWAIVQGSDMGPGDGWFHPSQGRYGWEWLAARYDLNHDGAIDKSEFLGPAKLFEELDRDRDGAVTAEDLDWSDKSTFLRQTAQAERQFYRADANSNGRVTREEWDAFFTKAAKGKKYLLPDDLKMALYRPTPRRPAGEKEKGTSPDEPTRLILLKGLLTGEVGSFHEGPAVEDLAPDFTLATQDGQRRVSLSDSRGRKPVVLVFGSFT